MTFPKTSLILLLLFSGLFTSNAMPLFAQGRKDTVQNIIITAPSRTKTTNIKNQFTAGQQNLQFDSSILKFYRELPLSNLITEQSPVFVKSYGVNSMATLSIRGASAAQSEVLWNGVPITNAAIGVSDVSLLQGGLFNNISIQYGGSSALFGSGNVGGALLLADKIPDFTPLKKLSLNIGSGSFHRKNGIFKAEWQNHHWHIGMKTFYEAAKNDFPYQDAQKEQKRMPNAQMTGIGGIFSADYRFKRKIGSSTITNQTLSLKIWYQQYNREIPPALFESFSVKKQQNQAFHSLIKWQQKRKRSLFYTKISFNHEYLNYQDGVVLPNNENKVNQWFAEVGWQWQINNPRKAQKWLHNLLIFAPIQWAKASGENLNNYPNQFRPAISAAYQLHTINDRIYLNFAARRAWWNNHKAAWLPGFNGSYRIVKSATEKHFLSISCLGNVQKSYRVPNLNELYFSPGGNPNLKPEHGWNETIGLAIRLNFNSRTSLSDDYTWKFANHTSYFNRNIKDWIYWLGGAIWTPHNLAAVHSRGVETESKLSWKQQKTTISLGIKTAYVLATTTKSYLPNDGSIGKQIPYTPRYRAIGNLNFSIGLLFINYNQNYTGYRFITTDESQFLKPYQSGNLQAAYRIRLKQYQIILSGQIRNIWNKRFEVVNGRPMPGRNFMLNLKLAWQE